MFCTLSQFTIYPIYVAQTCGWGQAKRLEAKAFSCRGQTYLKGLKAKAFSIVISWGLWYLYDKFKIYFSIFWRVITTYIGAIKVLIKYNIHLNMKKYEILSDWQIINEKSINKVTFKVSPLMVGYSNISICKKRNM